MKQIRVLAAILLAMLSASSAVFSQDGSSGGAAPDRQSICGDPKLDRIFKHSEVDRKAVLTSIPKPGFTKEAKDNGIQGVVRLRVVLCPRGVVSHMRVIKGLPDGLTEQAIMAARRIKFIPARKDGVSVAQYVILEYNFNTYDSPPSPDS